MFQYQSEWLDVAQWMELQGQWRFLRDRKWQTLEHSRIEPTWTNNLLLEFVPQPKSDGEPEASAHHCSTPSHPVGPWPRLRITGATEGSALWPFLLVVHRIWSQYMVALCRFMSLYVALPKEWSLFVPEFHDLMLDGIVQPSVNGLNVEHELHMFCQCVSLH